MSLTDCQDVRLALADRIEREESIAGDPRLDEHLVSCASCRAFAKDVRTIVVDLAELRGLSVLDDRPVVRLPVLRGWRWTGAAAAIAAVVAMFVLFPQGHDRDGSQPLVQVLTPPTQVRPVSRMVRLEGASRERYFAVEREEPTSGVRVIWLHKQFDATAAQQSDDSGGRSMALPKPVSSVG